MVRSCSAAFCNNSGVSVSYFKFPSNPEDRKKWTEQVQRTRKFWEGPTSYSTLCSAHFTEVCFEPSSALAASFGLKINRRLKPGAIPTIFERPKHESICESKSQLSVESSSSSTKRSGGAYRKRERSRVVAQLLAAATEEEKLRSAPKEVGVQVVPLTQDRDVQVAMPTGSKRARGTQVHPKVCDASVQCDLVGLPGVEFPVADDENKKLPRKCQKLVRTHKRTNGGVRKAAKKHPRTNRLKGLVAVHKHPPSKPEPNNDSTNCSDVFSGVENLAVQALCNQYNISDSISNVSSVAIN